MDKCENPEEFDDRFDDGECPNAMTEVDWDEQWEQENIQLDEDEKP